MSNIPNNDILDAPLPAGLKQLTDFQLIGLLEENHHFARVQRTFVQQELMQRGLETATIQDHHIRYRKQEKLSYLPIPETGWLWLLGGAILPSLFLTFWLKLPSAVVIIGFSIYSIRQHFLTGKDIGYYWRNFGIVLMLILLILIFGVHYYESL